MIFSFTDGMKDVSCKSGDPRNSLPPGTVLQLNGYSNPEYVIIKNQGVNERSPYTGALYKTINLTDGTVGFREAFTLKFLKDKTRGGIQCYITDRVMTSDEIMDAIKFAEGKEKERIAAKAAKDQAMAEEREVLLKTYAGLMKAGTEDKSDRVIAATNIRKELKEKFPGVKFSVRSRSFSMGNSIDIEWTDGPSTAEVEAITNKYEQGSFDGMNDIYEYYKDNQFTKIYGGAKYVMTQRRTTKEVNNAS